MNRLLILLLLITSACSTSRKPPLNEGRDLQLEKHQWVLRELQGIEINTTDDAKLPELHFANADNVLSGFGGCNTMNGLYTVHDDLIKLQVMTKTLRACADTAMNHREVLFFETLDSSEHYKLYTKIVEGARKDWLDLYKGKEKIAAFEAMELTP